MTSAHGVLLLVVSESLSPPGYNGGGGPCGSQKRKSMCGNCLGVVLFGPVAAPHSSVPFANVSCKRIAYNLTHTTRTAEVWQRIRVGPRRCLRSDAASAWPETSLQTSQLPRPPVL
jgi:hypothetical protein